MKFAERIKQRVVSGVHACASLVAVGVVLVAGRGADAQVYDVLMGSGDLLAVEGALGFADGAVQIGGNEEVFEASLDGVLFVVARESTGTELPAASVGESPIGVLTTTDGRRLFGRVASGDGQAVVWETLLRDPMKVELEEIASIDLDARDDDAARGRAGVRLNDRVTLINGDVLEGFVLEVGQMIEVETASEVRSIELARARLIELANPRRASSRVMVSLRDGSVLGVETLTGSGADSLVLAGGDAGSGIEVRSGDVLGVVVRPGSVRGLASLELQEHEPLSSMRWIEPPSLASHRLGLGEVSFSGPTRARWRVPEEARRFIARVHLPKRTQPWGACEVMVLGVRGREIEQLASVRVDGGQRVAMLDAGVEGFGEILIEVREGAHGPVLDAPVLERAVFVLGPAASGL